MYWYYMYKLNYGTIIYILDFFSGMVTPTSWGGGAEPHPGYSFGAPTFCPPTQKKCSGATGDDYIIHVVIIDS
jgi:hypothetical protein